MTTAQSDTAVRAPVHGPGTLLAQARADLHLAQEEVAAKLHLATRQIQALEQDDYSSLPGEPRPARLSEKLCLAAGSFPRADPWKHMRA